MKSIFEGYISCVITNGKFYSVICSTSADPLGKDSASAGRFQVP